MTGLRYPEGTTDFGTARVSPGYAQRRLQEIYGTKPAHAFDEIADGEGAVKHRILTPKGNRPPQTATIATGPHMGKKPGAGRAKYGNQKCEADGKKFDSKKEKDRYHELMARLRAGNIVDLRLQVRYVLIDKCKRQDGTWERATHYVADFVYFDKRLGRLVVEDVKSEITLKNPVYVIKRKLMLSRYGITVSES